MRRELRTNISRLVQSWPPPYLGPSVPLAYSPYLTSGLVSPLLGSEQQLQHHQQPQHQPQTQPHIQQNIQNKQRPERIEVSQTWASQIWDRVQSSHGNKYRRKPGGLSHHTKLSVNQLAPTDPSLPCLYSTSLRANVYFHWGWLCGVNTDWSQPRIVAIQLWQISV